MPAEVIYLYPRKMAEMFCVHCGAELLRGIDRCPECGKALFEVCEIGFDSVYYETYEVVFFGHVYKGRCRNEPPKLKFWAGVTEGPCVSAGTPCNVGESPSFEGKKEVPESDNQEHTNALADLTKKLTEDGWQPLATGEQWYGRRFRRRVW